MGTILWGIQVVVFLNPLYLEHSPIEHSSEAYGIVSMPTTLAKHIHVPFMVTRREFVSPRVMKSFS